ncbi:hypothetical protein GQF01_00550 [Paenibacillus sp. 5J-6]|jgi:hypothetical protein|uniref:Periplasmic protein n=1 Tax=Paenibacillus silvestris TaxID=2606219 RepID=A0A6L8URS5_9BACL|nr:hypothetical protein [Paenibacillus silvestris]MZQ80644.1 hypothetical protein [Paenibacillus silvestris]
MRDKTMNRWSTYDPFYIKLADKKVVDIIITHHAHSRYRTRLGNESTQLDEIYALLWEKLKSGSIASYYRNEEDVYVIDDDLLFVAQFVVDETETDLLGDPLHKMIVITFLGKMSESIELRDLRSYYTWLRHSRRMTLIKNGRKR